MTVRITRNGQDQYEEIQAALDTDRTVFTDEETGEVQLRTDVVLASDDILCDRTLIVRDHTNLCAENPGNGIQTITDEGPTKTWEAMRNRQHLRIEGDDVLIHGLTITGTNETANRSPNIRDENGKVRQNYLENQAGIVVAAATDVWVADCNISHVWGDLVGVAPVGSGKNTRMCNQIVFTGGTWHTSGRHGFGANGARNLSWYDCTIHDYVSSMFHIEAGTKPSPGIPAGNPYATQNDIYLEKIRSGGKGTGGIHVGGWNRIDRLEAKDIYDEQVLTAHVAAYGPRYTDFVLDGFVWAGTVREVCNLWNIDRVTIRNFAGKVMRQGALVDSAGIATCKNVVLEHNDIDLV